jgi:hypothetical protein
MHGVVALPPKLIPIAVLHALPQRAPLLALKELPLQFIELQGVRGRWRWR